MAYGRGHGRTSFFFFFIAGLGMISMIAVVPGTSALKVTGFRVPPVALYGSDVHLDCPFSSPSRTKLYSVKWYQNQDEFFRYIFADQTPATAFNLPGIKVDLNRSNSSRVTLKNVNLNTSATFRCEVSADEPDFQTVMRQANLTVIQISDDGPMISGARERYELNEQLDVNCTAPRIRPDTLTAAHRLTWHLNNQTVEGQTARKQMQDQDGATIGLRLILTERHFDLKTGVLKLECTASIAGRTQNYFTRSHEVMAALIYPTPVYVDPMRPTQRSAKSSKDSRSASYSSGGRRQCLFPIVSFLVVIPFALTWF